MDSLNNILNRYIMILVLPQKGPPGYNGDAEFQGLSRNQEIHTEANGISK